MKNLEDIKKSLSEDRPASWSALPDIDLYMDQVLGYMRRQLISSRSEAGVTAAMINNYIRDGILPRTNGKKYSKNHIAKLTSICAMKQILSVGDISLLFQLLPSDDMEDLYGKYREMLNHELTIVAKSIPESGDNQTLVDAITHFTIIGYANKIAAECLMDMLKEQTDEDKTKSKEKNKKETPAT